MPSNKKSSRKAKILPQFSTSSGNKPLLDLLEIQRKSFFHLLEYGIAQELAKIATFKETAKDSTSIREIELVLNPETYKLVAPNCTPKEAILKGKTYACKLYAQATLTIQSAPHRSDQETDSKPLLSNIQSKEKKPVAATLKGLQAQTHNPYNIRGKDQLLYLEGARSATNFFFSSHYRRLKKEKKNEFFFQLPKSNAPITWTNVAEGKILLPFDKVDKYSGNIQRLLDKNWSTLSKENFFKNSNDISDTLKDQLVQSLHLKGIDISHAVASVNDLKPPSDIKIRPLVAPAPFYPYTPLRFELRGKEIRALLKKVANKSSNLKSKYLQFFTNLGKEKSSPEKAFILSSLEKGIFEKSKQNRLHTPLSQNIFLKTYTLGTKSIEPKTDDKAEGVHRKTFGKKKEVKLLSGRSKTKSIKLTDSKPLSKIIQPKAVDRVQGANVNKFDTSVDLGFLRNALLRSTPLRYAKYLEGLGKSEDSKMLPESERKLLIQSCRRAKENALSNLFETPGAMSTAWTNLDIKSADTPKLITLDETLGGSLRWSFFWKKTKPVYFFKIKYPPGFIFTRKNSLAASRLLSYPVGVEYVLSYPERRRGKRTQAPYYIKGLIELTSTQDFQIQGSSRTTNYDTKRFGFRNPFVNKDHEIIDHPEGIKNDIQKQEVSTEKLQDNKFYPKELSKVSHNVNFSAKQFDVVFSQRSSPWGYSKGTTLRFRWMYPKGVRQKSQMNLGLMNIKDLYIFNFGKTKTKENSCATKWLTKSSFFDSPTNHQVEIKDFCFPFVVPIHPGVTKNNVIYSPLQKNNKRFFDLTLTNHESKKLQHKTFIETWQLPKPLQNKVPSKLTDTITYPEGVKQLSMKIGTFDKTASNESFLSPLSLNKYRHYAVCKFITNSDLTPSVSLPLGFDFVDNSSTIRRDPLQHLNLHREPLQFKISKRNTATFIETTARLTKHKTKKKNTTIGKDWSSRFFKEHWKDIINTLSRQSKKTSSNRKSILSLLNKINITRNYWESPWKKVSQFNTNFKEDFVSKNVDSSDIFWLRHNEVASARLWLRQDSTGFNTIGLKSPNFPNSCLIFNEGNMEFFNEPSTLTDFLPLTDISSPSSLVDECTPRGKETKKTRYEGLTLSGSRSQQQAKTEGQKYKIVGKQIVINSAHSKYNQANDTIINTFWSPTRLTKNKNYLNKLRNVTLFFATKPVFGVTLDSHTSFVLAQKIRGNEAFTPKESIAKTRQLSLPLGVHSSTEVTEKVNISNEIPFTDAQETNSKAIHQVEKIQTFHPWIFLGELPLMTKRGHFILNGSPRVIVNQIARCPGIYFQEKRRGVGFEQEVRVSADIIPQRGPWLRIQSDWEGRFWARLKQEGRVKYATLYEAFQEFEKQYSTPLVSLIVTSSSPFPKSETLSFQEKKAKEDRQKKALIRLFKNSIRYSLGDLGRFRINERVHSIPLLQSTMVRTSSHASFRVKNSSTPLGCSLAGPPGVRKDEVDKKKNLVPALTMETTFRKTFSRNLLSNEATTSLLSYLLRNPLLVTQVTKLIKERVGTLTSPSKVVDRVETVNAPNYLVETTKWQMPIDMKKTSVPTIATLQAQRVFASHNLLTPQGEEKTESKNKLLSFDKVDKSLDGNRRLLEWPDNENKMSKNLTSLSLTLTDLCDQVISFYPKGFAKSEDSSFYSAPDYRIQNKYPEGFVHAVKRQMDPEEVRTASLEKASFTSAASQAIRVKGYEISDLGKSIVPIKSLVSSLNGEKYLLMAEDIDAVHTCLERLLEGQGFTDDIDHLKNRFIRTSGKLLQQQFELGLHRLNEVITPLLKNLIQGPPLSFLSTSTNTDVPKDFAVVSKRKRAKTSGEDNLTKKGQNTPSQVAPKKKATTSNSLTSGLHQIPEKGNPLFSSTSSFDRSQQPEGVDQTENLSTNIASLTSKALASSASSVYPKKGRAEGARSRQHSSESRSHQVVGKNNYKTVTSPFRWLRTSKPINGAFREFFGSNPLSQYMDQSNPLAEITHKRRLSSMGPGGIKRETAGMEVRGIHPTHYGRICPIETPEGKNAGLVNSPTVYGRVGHEGFMETPLYQVVQNQIQRKRWAFFSAQQEEDEESSLATCDVGLTSFNLLAQLPIPVQTANNPLAHFQQVERNRVGYRALSPVQTISIATALIPFLEHDDANRALMGSNMQRQAIPLLLPERPVVGTGFEPIVIAESGQALQATKTGYVSHGATRFL